MGVVEELEGRVKALEERAEALADVVNALMELVYGPSFVAKLDKLARHGEKDDE